MSIIEQANQVGDWILLAGLPASLYFTLRYVLSGAKWWKSLIGWMFVVLGSGLVILQVIVLLSLFLGSDYPGRFAVRIIGYGFLTLALYYVCIVYEIERRSPTTVLPVQVPALTAANVRAWWARLRARVGR